MNRLGSPIKPKGIKGFIETSFLDWDGALSSVIFLPFCNFRCPFCQNWQLLDEAEKIEDVDWAIIESYLKRQRHWIDGAVITGGEPTVYPDLKLLLGEIKRLGSKVKLDTNGYNPSLLKELWEEKLIDYIAMDIKAPIDERYELASGIEGLELGKIRESIRFLLAGEVDYEFRTTLVPSLVSATEIKAMGEAIGGAKRWVLQDYQAEPARAEAYRRLQPYKREYVEYLVSIAKNYAKDVSYRGKRR